MLAPSSRIWWKPFGRHEKTWFTIALVWCILLTLMMPFWFVFGKQNVPATSYRTTPQQYQKTVEAFVAAYKVGEEKGIPIVSPPPGSDVYLRASMWQWYPILKLKKGATYRLHLSSMDIQHGFSLQPVNLNLQVLPGYEYVATITPTTAGEFRVICNEYCYLGHHVMAGKLIVTEE